MLRRLVLISLCLSPAAAARGQSADELLQRAIAAAGGQAALEAAPALQWEGTATIHIPNRTIEIAGHWMVRPDSAVVATWPVEQGPAAIRRLIMAGASGSTQRGDAAPVTMPPELLVEERHQFYLYSLLRLVTLRDPATTLHLAPGDSLGRTGLRVRHPDHPDVILYFGADDRVSGLLTVFAAADMSHPDAQVIRFTGSVESSGVRWFREMRIARGGRPYFDLRLTEFRASPLPANPSLPSR